MTADRPVSAPGTVTDDLVRAYCATHDAYFAGPPPEDNDPDSGVRAGLEAVVPLIRERVAAGRVAVDPADLRTVLDQDTAHYHSRPGVWDDDNPPERAGRSCVECAARGRLRVALEGDGKGVTKRPTDTPLPGEAVECPACGSRIGLTRHRRIANHDWPATPIRCPGSGTPVPSAGEEPTDG